MTAAVPSKAKNKARNERAGLEFSTREVVRAKWETLSQVGEKAKHLYQGEVSSGREKRKQSPVRPLLAAQRAEPRSYEEVFRGGATLP